MANAFTQIHLQFIFAVQNLISFIKNSFKSDLYKYIITIVKNNDHKLIAMNGIPDHLHLLIGMRPTESIAHLISMAGRIRCIFILYIPSSACNKIYGEPGIISQKKSFIEEYKEILDKFEIHMMIGIFLNVIATTESNNTFE